MKKYKLIIEGIKKDILVLFDIENKELIFGDTVFPLQSVYNDFLLLAIKNKKIVANAKPIKEKKVIYYCVRKVLEKTIEKSNFYWDILLYSQEKDTLFADYMNRSIGHFNDKQELELHQVLSGEVVELIYFNDNYYVGKFGKGDVFEIPSGAFHCTYILQPNTVVCNMYSNVFWENDFSKKPYFNMVNDIHLIKKKDNVYLQREKCLILLDSRLKNIKRAGFFLYEDIEKKYLKITNQEYGGENIFQIL